MERIQPAQPGVKVEKNWDEGSSGARRTLPATPLPVRMRTHIHPSPSSLGTSSRGLRPASSLFTSFPKRGPKLSDHSSCPGHFMHIKSSTSHFLTPSPTFPFLLKLFLCDPWNSVSWQQYLSIRSSTSFLNAPYFVLTLALLRHCFSCGSMW